MNPSEENPVEKETPMPENTPAETEGELDTSFAVASEPVKPRPSWAQKALPWVIVTLVSLLVGFAIGFFLLYLPANTGLKQVQTDLSELQGKLDSTTQELETTQSNLSQAQSDAEKAQAAADTLTFNLALSRVQANVGLARLALAQTDLLTARQELSAADTNLKELVKGLDAETAKALQDRLSAIRIQLNSDSKKAVEELRILGENLGRIEPK